MDQNNKKDEKPDTSPSPTSLADLVVEEQEISLSQSVKPASWAKVAVLGLLVGLFYRVEIGQLINQWLADANWSHGFILPLFSLYLLYNWRRDLFEAPRRVCIWGLAVVILAIAIKAYGFVILHNKWIPQLTIPLMIWGMVLFLGGWKMARITFVPIFFLTLAMPLPDRIYQMISLPMQDLAAKMSAGILKVCGVQIEVTASFLQVTSISGKVHPLQVAEACSGMRSLMAFVALGVAMAYVEERPFWQRLVIILAGVPIALVCNILRVTGTCTMFVIDKKELGEGFMHSMMGMVLLIPALFLLFLLTRLLSSMYEDVEEDEDDEDEDEQNDEDKSDSSENAPADEESEGLS